MSVFNLILLICEWMIVNKIFNHQYFISTAWIIWLRQVDDLVNKFFNVVKFIFMKLNNYFVSIGKLKLNNV